MPGSLHEIRTRLIRDWISARATIDGQCDGLEAIACATQSVLAMMIGRDATRAVLTHAVAKAARRNADVELIRVVDDSLDLTAFRSLKAERSLASSAEARSLVVDGLIIVLFRLLGSMAMTILREVHAELDGSATSEPEVWPADPGLERPLCPTN
jgi:hypothetical protein